MLGRAKVLILPLLLLVSAAFLAPGAAQAQGQPEACRAPVLAVQQAPEAFEPGEATSLLFAIENPNGAPVEAVRATVTTSAPAGWTATTAQRELTLGPRNVSLTAISLTAPNRGTGVAAGNITILVTFVCTRGDIQTSASADTVLEVRITDFQAPWPIVLGSLTLLAVGVALMGYRRLRRGVAILPTQSERTVEPGKSVKYTFVVENRRGRPQRFHLLPIGVPEGWVLHLALENVELEPGEEKTLWAILKAPPEAAEGTDVLITLRLENVRGGRDGASAPIRARVVASA